MDPGMMGLGHRLPCAQTAKPVTFLRSTVLPSTLQSQTNSSPNPWGDCPSRSCWRNEDLSLAACPPQQPGLSRP